MTAARAPETETPMVDGRSEPTSWDVALERLQHPAPGQNHWLATVRPDVADSAAASLSNDVLVGCLTFLVWSFVEARRLAMKRWWIYPLLTFGIAFAFAFPLFLCLRERRLHDAAAAR